VNGVSVSDQRAPGSRSHPPPRRTWWHRNASSCGLTVGTPHGTQIPVLPAHVEHHHLLRRLEIQVGEIAHLVDELRAGRERNWSTKCGLRAKAGLIPANAVCGTSISTGIERGRPVSLVRLPQRGRRRYLGHPHGRPPGSGLCSLSIFGKRAIGVFNPRTTMG
jgi:hypothetical protein